MDTKNHPFFTHREARRQERLNSFEQVKEAIHEASSWDSHAEFGKKQKHVNSNDIIFNAVQLVAGVIDNFNWPMKPEIHYSGVKQASFEGNNPKGKMTDGVIMLTAKFQTITGVRKEAYIPVMVREGKLLEPSVMMVDGTLRVMGQSTINDILDASTMMGGVQDRKHMFSPPSFEEYKVDQPYRIPDQVPLFRRRMFSSKEMKGLIGRLVRGQSITSVFNKGDIAEHEGHEVEVVKDLGEGTYSVKNTETEEEFSVPVTQLYKFPEDWKTEKKEGQFSNKIFVESPSGWRGWVKPETAKEKGYKSVEPKEQEHTHKTDEAVSQAAESGDVSILNHPEASKVVDARKNTPLHYLAYSGKGSDALLKHPDVAKVKNDTGRTPLHILASQGNKEVLKHPAVYKVKDSKGNTPLHELAKSGVREVLSNPYAFEIKNNEGKTPEDYFRSTLKKSQLAENKQAQDSSDSMVDASEQDQSDWLKPGDDVELTQGKRVKNRGGGSYVIPKGTKGTIRRDESGDGQRFEVKIVDEPCHVIFESHEIKKISQLDENDKEKPVEYVHCPSCGALKSKTHEYCLSCLQKDPNFKKSSQSVDSIIDEIKSLYDQGYKGLDIILAIKKKYDETLANKALETAKSNGLIQV